jgi:aminopeptidase YwaD
MPLRASLETSAPATARPTRGGWPRLFLAALALTASLLATPASAATLGPARDAWWQPVADTAALGAAESVSQEQAYAHARVLSGDLGSRMAHREAYRRAAEYARDYLTSLGYQVEMQEFLFPHWEDLGSQVRLDAEGRTIRAVAMRDSPDLDVEAELVDVGLARPGDVGERRLDGKIALARRGEVTFRAKAEAVKAAGARGLIIYNNERGQLLGRLGEGADLPTVGISADDGAALTRQLGGGPLGVRVVARSLAEDRPSLNVIAHGGDPAESGRVLVGAHLDSVEAGPGANDNASGSAAVLELARVFAGRPERARLSFALFGAEEWGLWGSRRYVERLGEGGARRLRAMVNLDMVAVGDRFEIGAAGQGGRDLQRRALDAAAELGYRASPFDAGGSSDHASFSAAGVPAVMIHWREDPNYHQPTDTIDKLDPEKLVASTRTVARVLEGLLVQ